MSGGGGAEEREKQVSTELQKSTLEDVTAALVAAMERAGETDQVLIVMREKAPDDDEGRGRYRIFTTDGTTVKDLNWLIDVAKSWLLDL